MLMSTIYTIQQFLSSIKNDSMVNQHENSLSISIGMALGPRIAERRKSLGMTQNDLAAKLNVEVETISRFERGFVLPSLKRLAFLAEILQTGLPDLLTGVSPHAGAQAKVLNDTLTILDNEDRVWLVSMVQQFANRLATPKHSK
jgi:transcriptional regulator with XRE-family HTH domain